MGNDVFRVSLRALRVNAKMTQMQVADAADINIERYKRAERNSNAKPLNLSELSRLCKLYGCKLDNIRTWDGDVK